MSPEQLAEAEAAYRAASAEADKLREVRNELVRQALANGWTHAKIAEVTGLSRGRISQFRGSPAKPSTWRSGIGVDVYLRGSKG